MGLGINFHSHTYFNFKLNNIRTLIHRAFALSSSWHAFHIELEFLREYFSNNVYPRNIIDSITKHFLNRKLNPRKETMVGKMPLFHKMPFVNNYSCRYIKKDFVHFLKQCYRQVDFNFIFCNTFTNKSSTRHKEKLPMTLESGIVYLFSCGGCNATYVRSSVKILKTRICEHCAVSSHKSSIYCFLLLYAGN